MFSSLEPLLIKIESPMTAAAVWVVLTNLASRLFLALGVAAFLRDCATAADIHLINSEPLRFSCDLRYLQMIDAF
jgi:hypothetical protein